MTLFEQSSLQQKKVIQELAEIWGHEGFPMMVFKGQANASLYPIPNHRATGNIDCWQFVFMKGFSELDDVMHKMLGCMIGYGVYFIGRYGYELLIQVHSS